MKKEILSNNNINRQRKICLNKMNYYNSYEDWTKMRNEFSFKKIKKRNSTYSMHNNNTNSLLLNRAPRKFIKFHKNFFITKTNNNNVLFSIDKEDNKKSLNYRNIKELQDINAKIFKNALKSLRNLSKNKTQVNFFSHDFDFSSSSNLNTNKYIFSEIKNEDEIPKIKKTKNKLNQTSSLLSTKISQNRTIYFNSSLDNFYHKISNKKLKINSPLNNKTRDNFYPSKSNNIDFISNIIKLYGEENKKDKGSINEEDFVLKKDNKINKGINLKEKKDKNDEDNIVTSSGFNSYNQIILKNLFQKCKAKIKLGILDRVILDYNLKTDDILLNPFYNSYGVMLDDVSEKVGFMKGSLNLVYPRIIQKKYQIKAEQSIKKIGLLRSNSDNDFKRNKNDIKNNLFTIKDKNIIQSVFTKYPMYIKLNGKFSPHLYTYKGQNRFSHKLQKQNLFMNKVNQI